MVNLSNSENLCERCSQINLEDLKGAYGCLHQPSFQALVDSTSGCKLCKLISEACVHYLERNGKEVDAETSHMGPIRLFATDRKGCSSGMERRTFEALQGGQLSPKVIVTVGKLKQPLFISPSWSILLEIYTLRGISLNSEDNDCIYSSYLDYTVEQAGIPRLREIESHAACEANFSRIRKWLEQCKRNHNICSLEHIQRLIGPSSMPKRLIDLGASSAPLGTPKIIHTRGRQEQYITLSYCWGTAQHLSTNSKNLGKMEKSIPVEELPQTIRDAFLVAQKLDIRYIWIDALCIIQDSEEDWNSEARRMGAIYANSYFTIAATTAKHTGEGFLWSRALEGVSIPFRRNAIYKTEGNIYFKQPADFLRDHQEYILNSPLQKRAWVLQETLLSRRTVHFSSKQMYWECRSKFDAEDGVTDDADCREHAHEFLNMLSVLEGGFPSEHHAMMFFRVWGKILSRYSTLSITRPSDKLSALSGLASLAERILGYRYLYGIWSFNLPYGLFWQPVSRLVPQAEEWRAPSWSWAAGEGEILFEKYFPEEDSTIRFTESPETSQLRGALEIVGHIHSCYVSLDLQPQPKTCRSDRKLKKIPITPPEYAFAEDRSKLAAYQTSTETTLYDLYGETPGISLLRITEGRVMSAQGPGERNVCRFDGERGNETDFFFLRLSCANQIKFHHCRGLLLRRATGATIAYERVGIGWSTDSLWHTTSESLVTLV